MLQYNSRTGNYQVELSDGSLLIVEGDEYAEAEQEGVSEADLSDWTVWENCVNGESIRVESK